MRQIEYLILRLAALLDIFIRFMYIFCYCYSLVFTEDTFFVRVLTNLIKFIINHLQLKNLIAPWTVRLIQMTPIKQMFPVNRTYLFFVKLGPFCIDKNIAFSPLECCFIFLFVNYWISCFHITLTVMYSCSKNIETMQTGFTYSLQSNSS